MTRAILCGFVTIVAVPLALAFADNAGATTHISSTTYSSNTTWASSGSP